jgi:glycogen(starch) synthase
MTNMYPPHHYGGYELSCMEGVGALRAAGHDVLVLTSDHRVDGVDAADDDPSSTRRELRMYWRDHRITRPSPVAALAHERHNQRVVRSAIEDHQPDVVSAWNMGALSLGVLATCRSRGVPVVAVIEDDWLVYGPLVDRWQRVARRLGPLGRVAERAAGVPSRLPRLGEESAVLFISEETRRNARRSPWWQGARETIVYWGVNPNDFPLRDEPARAEWAWRLLHVGRVDDRKGIDTCIRALALLPGDATLEVVGRGDDHHLAELRALADDLGVSERVAFSVSSRDDLASRYTAADALLFTPRWAEPFGLVPLEAMACATPVVATGTGGSGEFLVDEANCLRVPVDDPAAIAAAVQRLAGDLALRQRLVEAGRATAAELSTPRWLELIVQWHEGAASGFAHGSPPDRSAIEVALEAVLTPRADPA